MRKKRTILGAGHDSPPCPCCLLPRCPSLCLVASRIACCPGRHLPKWGGSVNMWCVLQNGDKQKNHPKASFSVHGRRISLVKIISIKKS